MSLTVGAEIGKDREERKDEGKGGRKVQY